MKFVDEDEFGKSSWSESYKYDKKGFPKAESNYKYKRNKKGFVVKKVLKGNSYDTTNYEYDNKGRVAKVSSGSYGSNYISYSKKGLPTSIKHVSSVFTSKKTLKYNKKGQLVQVKSGSDIYSKYTYKKGRLVKKAGDDNTTKYSCKKVSVPKKYKSMVEAQQRAILLDPLMYLPTTHP